MKKNFWLSIMMCSVLILCCIGCTATDTSQSDSSTALSEAAPSSQANSSVPNTSHIVKSEIIATVEHNGQTLQFEYIELDFVYPWDIRYVEFVNGYAVLYDYNEYVKGNIDKFGYNAIDQYGNPVFTTSDNQFAYITNFNADGLAIAQKYDDEKQYVVNTSGEITDISASSIEVPGSNNESQPSELKDMTGVVATSRVCNGLIAFVKDGKLGFADSDGNVLVQTTVGIEFEEMIETLAFNEDIIAFELDDDLEYSPIAMIKVHRNGASTSSIIEAKPIGGVVLLGGFENYEKFKEEIKTSKYLEDFPYLSTLAETEFVSTGNGIETFAIIPPSGLKEFSVYTLTYSSDYSSSIRMPIYQASGDNIKPIVLKCNMSDLIPDNYIIAEYENGTIDEFSISTSLKDGSVRIDESVNFKDLTKY